jgi:hypothetical protein
MDVSLVFQILIITILVLLITIRYTKPWLIGETFNSDNGYGCDVDETCYEKCDLNEIDEITGEPLLLADDFSQDTSQVFSGKCSDPEPKNRLYNIIILIVFAILIITFSLHLKNKNSFFISFMFLLSSLVIYISLRFSVEYSNYEQVLIKPQDIGDELNEFDKLFILNNKNKNKSLVLLTLYFGLTYMFYFGLWMNNDNYKILKNTDIIFVFTYFSYSMYLFIDMIKNTKADYNIERGGIRDSGVLFQTIKKIFNFDITNDEDQLFDNSWILYSLVYSVYLIYILFIGQIVSNSLEGTGDPGQKYYAIITIITICINFYHFNNLKKIKDECNNCNNSSSISIFSNNLKMYQVNLVLITIGILYIIVTKNTKMTNITSDLKNFIK